MSAVPTPNLRQLLRQSTSPVHRELDALSPLGAERLTREGYALHLRALAPLVWFVERAFYTTDAWKRLVPDHARRMKAGLLRKDLEALGVSPDFERSAAPLTISSFGYGMGAAYVLEGSTLGGVQLARRVREGLGAAAPVRYLTAYGAETGSMWSAFCAVLADIAEPLHVSACAGAHDAFEVVKNGFVALNAARN